MRLSPTTLEAEFPSEFFKAVRAGLGEVVGDSGTQSVLFHIRMGAGQLGPADVDKRLVALFGQQAARTIEMAIALDLSRRLDLPLPAFTVEETFDFVASIKAAERAYKSP